MITITVTKLSKRRTLIHTAKSCSNSWEIWKDNLSLTKLQMGKLTLTNKMKSLRRMSSRRKAVKKIIKMMMNMIIIIVMRKLLML
jgi:hypothetical protein